MNKLFVLDVPNIFFSRPTEINPKIWESGYRILVCSFSFTIPRPFLIDYLQKQSRQSWLKLVQGKGSALQNNSGKEKWYQLLSPDQPTPPPVNLVERDSASEWEKDVYPITKNSPSRMGENRTSNVWICRRFEHAGGFVPFLLNVGEHILEVGEFVIFTHFLFQICHQVFTHFLLPFHPLADFAYLYLSISPNSFLRFTHLQISPTCRFHLLADCIYLHVSCVKISVVCVRLHDIFTHCFLSPVVPHKPIFTHNALSSGFNHLQISPTFFFVVVIPPHS